MNYDEESVFKTSPYLLNRLVSVDSPTAKEFIKDLLKEEEQYVISFSKGTYTLVAIRVYVLGLVFSSVKESSVVKLFTLIDQLDAAVRVQSQIERSCNKVIYK